VDEQDDAPSQEKTPQQETRGDRIRMVRRARNLRVVELAYALGVVDKTVYQWERDNRRPNDRVYPELARILEVSQEYLEYGVENIDNDEGAPWEVRLRRSEGLSDESLAIVRGVVRALKVEELHKLAELRQKAESFQDDDEPDGGNSDG
jgi:transcriptional regulator with XRE-family HTH domain